MKPKTNTNPSSTPQGGLFSANCPRLHSLASFGLRLAMLQMTIFTGMAMNIVTNCTDAGPSLPLPKRVTSACPTLGVPSFNVVRGLADPITGGFMAELWHNGDVNGGHTYSGLCKSDGDGVFQWKLAVTNGAFHPSVDIHRFGATQGRDLGAGPTALVGVYSDASGTPAPLFERRVPIDDWRLVSVAQLHNSMTVVALDKTNSIVLLGLNTGGETVWAKELASSEFPVVSLTNDLPHETHVSEINTNELLLRVSATEMASGTNTAKTVLVKLDSNGAIQWAKKVQMPIYIEDPTPYAAGLWPTPGGDYLIVILDLRGSFTPLTTLLKLNADGSFAWGKRITGVALGGGLEFIDPEGSIVLGLTTFGFSARENIYALMDPAGNLTSSLEVLLPDQGYANISGVSQTNGRIYFSGTYSAEASDGPYTGIIGSSSLALDDFVWGRYERSPVAQFDTELRVVSDGRLVYSAADVDGALEDLVLMDSNFVADADCAFFSPASFDTSSRALFPASVVPTVTNVVVQETSLSLNLDPAELVFEQLAFGEEQLCKTNCAFTLSAERVDLEASGASTNVSVAVDITVINGNACEWTVANPCPEWVTVTPTNGVGPAQVTISAASNASGLARYCRLLVGDQPILVSQVSLTSGFAPMPFQLIASGSDRLVRLETNPVAEALITNSFDYSFNALETAPDGRLYGIDSDDVRLIDPVTAVLQDMGSLRTSDGTRVRPESMAFAPNGELYAFDTSEDSLYTIDLNAGIATLVGQNTNKVPVSSIAFAPDGRLLGAYFDISEINPATGQVLSTIGSFPLFTFVTDITFAPDGFIYGVDFSFKRLYRINPETAEAENLGTFESYLYSVAWAPLPGGVPLQILSDTGSLGFSEGEFGFEVMGPAGATIVYEMSTNLQDWTPIETNVLSSGPYYFKDPQSSLSGHIFYRARLQ